MRAGEFEYGYGSVLLDAVARLKADQVGDVLELVSLSDLVHLSKVAPIRSPAVDIIDHLEDDDEMAGLAIHMNQIGTFTNRTGGRSRHGSKVLAMSSASVCYILSGASPMSHEGI